MAISYAKFKRTFGDLGITEWVKFNWLSNSGIARNIYNKVVETGYNPLAYVNNELYNRITKSINIWDEEWELGYIDNDNGNKMASSEYVMTKNYIRVSPNTTYYRTQGFWGAWYDENKVYISGFSGQQTLIAPSNAKYLLFTLYKQTTYNHDICINISNPYINGNYFPYFEGDKFLVLVGSVDLGTLNWIYDSKTPRFFASLSNCKPSTINAICSIYKYGSPFIEANDKVWWISNSSSLSIKDTSYNNTTNFKQAMSGVMFYYELATPVLIDL